MALTYHVTAGGVYCRTGTGSASALETFGVPEDGFMVNVTKHEKPFHTDVSGPMAPADIQDFGSEAIIRAKLIAYDLSVAYKIEKAAGQSTDGLLPAMGTLIGTGGYTFRFLIVSADDEVWNFPTTKLRNFSRKPSSERNVYDLELYAWGYVAPSLTTASTIVVYNRTSS